MATSAGSERWGDRLRQQWYLELLEHLRSGLTWMDAFVGFCAIAAIAIILISFRYQLESHLITDYVKSIALPLEIFNPLRQVF
jgi:hypothetical protein